MTSKPNVTKALNVFSIKVGLVGLGFVATLLLTRWYSTEVMGRFFWILSVATLLSAMFRFGQENELIKQVARSDSTETVNILTSKLLMLTFILSIASVLIAYLLAQSWSHRYVSAVIVGAITALISVIGYTLQAKGYANTQQVILNLPRLLVTVFALGGYVVFETHHALESLIAPAFVTGLCIALGCYMFKGFRFKASSGLLLTHRKQTINYLVIGVSVVLMAEVATILLGAIGTPEQVAIFAVATRLAYLVIFILLAFNSVITPQFAKLYKQHKLRELIVCYQQARVYSFFIAIIMAAVFYVLSKPLLALFGEAYIHGQTVLAVLLVTQVIKVYVGSAGQLLMMSGHAVTQRRCINIGVFVLIISCCVLIPLYGALGAAVATLLASTVNNLLALYFVNKYLSIPFSLAKSQ